MSQLIDSFNSWFDPQFRKLLSTQADQAISFSNSQLYSRSVLQVLDLAANGKRIRPYIIDLTIRSLNQVADQHHTRDQYAGLMNGVELFHLFALIHDDICDRAEHRRGVECINTVIAKEFGISKSESDSLAMLVGDLVFMWANQSISINNSLAVQNRYYQMIRELVYGEFIDVAQAVLPKVSSEQIADKTSYKSARYTFVQPAAMAFDFCGLEFGAGIETALHNIGLAFQIQDDYLDISSESSKFGKPLMQDLQEGQQTVFTDYLYSHSDEKYVTWITEHRGKLLNDDDVKRARQVFNESGALDYGRDTYLNLYHQGRNQIIDLFNSSFKNSLNDELENEWSLLISALETRSK